MVGGALGSKRKKTDQAKGSKLPSTVSASAPDSRFQPCLNFCSDFLH